MLPADVWILESLLSCEKKKRGVMEEKDENYSKTSLVWTGKFN